MRQWARLFLLLTALVSAGLLVVHYQTSVVRAGYRITGLMEEREGLKEKNRMLRIELGRAGVPDQVRESWKALSDSGINKVEEPGPALGQAQGAGRGDERETR